MEADLNITKTSLNDWGRETEREREREKKNHTHRKNGNCGRERQKLIKEKK